MTSHCRRQGLFVGLTTLDLIYRVTKLPNTNQKLVASDYVMAAGGPATNAAITFQHLSQQQSHYPTQTSSPVNVATILSVVGAHPIGRMVRAEVEQWNVAIADLNPTHPEPVPTSSIMVTEATGERAVISLNAVKCMAVPHQIPNSVDALWDQLGVILIDGHQMMVGEAIARRAYQDKIPIVIDAGSWKPGFEKVLPYATYVICSANFHPPDCPTTKAVHQFLRDLGVPHIAITHGSEPIDYWHNHNEAGSLPQLIAVPSITPVDTLGAGDIFHGAFCHSLIEATQSVLTHSLGDHPTNLPIDANPNPISQLDIPDILSKAAKIASTSCKFFGSRQWIQ